MALTDLPRPFIVCVLTDRAPDATIATMRLARLDGADAYELNLPLLAGAAPETLRAILAAVDRPTYTSCRRAGFMRVYGVAPESLPAWDDAERMQRQIDALALGSAALDMEMDTFDPNPAPPLGAPSEGEAPGEPLELTYDRAAVDAQREVIAAARRAAGQAVLSCHTGRPQPADSLIRIANVAAERGADLVKIVSPCPRLEDLLALLEATGRLRASLGVPFTLVGAGACGSPSRTVGATLGSGWVLAQQTLAPGGFHEQPLVAQAREILRLLPWRYAPEAGRFV